VKKKITAKITEKLQIFNLPKTKMLKKQETTSHLQQQLKRNVTPEKLKITQSMQSEPMSGVKF
jgi:hypothetical protein